MRLATRKFVRPEHLNHHQTLYAGYISECMTEAAFIALACTLGHTDHVVLAAMNEIRITKPTKAGEIIELLWEVSHDKCRIHDCREKYVGSGKPVFGKDCFCDSR